MVVKKAVTATVHKTRRQRHRQILCTVTVIRIAAAANDAAALKDELKDFKRKISEAGRTTYAARVGAHDDLVLSVAIALWMATNSNTVTHEEFRV
ncbi:hypothetical protein SSBR45G_05070 [Bradyrhizobium sp. SSBR45G]|uniref:hypothetical protein n=1 Tax=unclassified Bradyrhizobium TaxID=2631580 RepID=UPI0023428DF4|nr:MULTISPECIES: hypothetical protein [unclassified Bradyrhizobium]GLH75599.1 hypothetical protein SSBR45G_05070 [Bradyrhizobium sp. SSBR45G]GLH82611.1 hypothetical protein SSBR45R_00710 [Bradyrhizobium sp. SSBR45R]